MQYARRKKRGECAERKRTEGVRANEGATGEWIRTGVREERKSERTKASNERVRHSVRRKERAR